MKIKIPCKKCGTENQIRIEACEDASGEPKEGVDEGDTLFEIPGDSASPEKLLDLWTLTAKAAGLSVPRGWTPKRMVKARLRLKEHPGKEFWVEIMQKIKTSPFLQGENNQGWRVDFDWLITNQENCLKIIEGRYNGKSRY